MARPKSETISDEMLGKVSLAAELYYIYGMNQNAIAEQLGVSRVWISRLLKKAEELGIVRIEVNTTSAGAKELEKQLVDKYGLKSAKIIQAESSDLRLAYSGQAAANYITSILRPHDTISIFWGKTIAAMVQQFVPLDFPGVTVVPLVGGIGTDASLLSNQLAYQMANRIGATCHPLNAPGYVAGKKEKMLLLNDPSIQEAIRLSEHADIAVFGVGYLRNKTQQITGCTTEEEFAALEKVGAVGDIALHFVDAQGKLVDHPVADRLVSGDICLTRKNAREAIGVAVGTEKTKILHAALVGGWLDVLITDNETARLLIDYK